MIKILFVCMGNICRSPMAEAVMQDMINQAGLSDVISVDSAGTSSEHVGQTAFPDTLEILREHNIPYDGRARQIQRSDLKDFDYVLTMDRANLSYILRASSGARADIRLFLSFAKRAGLVNVDEVPDPYYDGNFEQTYELVTRGCRALLDHIRQAEKV
jgi:protein-tyrosine phosphatase